VGGSGTWPSCVLSVLSVLSMLLPHCFCCHLMRSDLKPCEENK
jgi:hypothetical protein